MYLTLPVPTGRGSTKIPIQQCLDAFVREEVMEKTDAWYEFILQVTGNINFFLGIVRIARLSVGPPNNYLFLDSHPFSSYI
jgi:hypothetical protein